MIHKPSKSTIEKCFKQTETVTREEKSIEELINQKLYDDENDGLERKYKRKEGYRLNLFVLTNQTIKYSDNLQELTNEIKDTMDIDSIIEAKVLFNSPGQIDIKLRTNNLDDFIKMRESSSWPLQIFGSETGVNVKVVSIELKLSISGVEKETIFDSKQLEKLMKQQQISNFERQCYNVGDIMVATNKVNFTADNLKAYVDAQKTGFFFVDGIKYKAKAHINYAKGCNNCGDLNHSKKYCRNRIRCMKCSESGHSEFECKSKSEYCFKCQNQSHRCDSENCEKIAEKTLEQNKLELSILDGEQIIDTRCELLRNRRTSIHQSLNIELIQNMIDLTLDEKIISRLDENERKIKEMSQNLNSISEDMEAIMSNNMVHTNKLDNLAVSIDRLLEISLKNLTNLGNKKINF